MRRSGLCRFFLGALVATLSAGVSHADPIAQPSVIVSSITYYFTGTCADCTSPYGVLKVSGAHAPGSAFQNSDLISFTYTSSVYVTPFTVTQANLISFSGSIGVSPGAFQVFLSGTPGVFSSSAGSGAWQIGPPPSNLDYGSTSGWSTNAPSVGTTPEPATLTLVGSGLALLTTVRRRRRA